MHKLSWRMQLMGLIAVVLGALLLFQLLYVIPFIRTREVEATQASQEGACLSIARELDIDLVRVEKRLGEIANLPDLRTMDTASQHQLLVRQQETAPMLSSLFVMGAEGWFVSGSVSDEEFSNYTTKSFADRPYFSVPFEQGQTYFAAARFYPEVGLVGASISVPIVSDGGERVGVLVGGMLLDEMIERVARYPLQEGTVAVVVDKEGTVVAHSGIDLFTLEDGPLSLDYSDRPMVQAVMSGEAAGSQIYEHDDVSYFGTYTILASNGWGVVVRRPMSAVLAGSEGLTRQLVLVNVGLFAIALAIALFLTGRIEAARKRTGDALRAEEVRAQQYLDIAGVAFVALDRDSCITLINRRGLDILGHQGTGLIGRNWFETCLPERLRGEVAAVFTQLMAGKVEPVEYYENPVLTSEGKERTIAWHNTVLRNETGDIVGILSSGEDITERIQAEEALRESEERFRSIFSQSPVGIELYEANGQLIDVNAACLELFGVSDVEAVRGFDLFEDPNLSPAARARLLEGEPVRTEFVFDFELVKEKNLYETTKSGQIHLETFITPFEILPEKRKRYLVHVTDVTERKQAEAALRESEETYRTLVTVSPDAVTATDVEGNITYVSKRTLDLHGYGDAGELLGKSAFGLIDPADREEALKNLQKALTEGVVRDAPYTLLRGDGTRFAGELSAALIRDAEGRPSGFVAITRDVTEREAMGEQFRQAQKMEAVGRLAGGVAHDFNNILTAMMGYVDFLAKGIDSDDARREDVEGIQRAAERATGLTRQLLAFSRRQVLKPRVVNLNDVIADVTKMLRRLIGEDVELVTVPASDLRRIKVDPGQMEQVIMNLVVNARDAMPRGGRVTIKTAEVDVEGSLACPCGEAHPGHYVVLTVSDSGGGMDEETRARVFEPFFTTKEKGTGLGLATVYGIVIQSGGHLTVESEPGQGTTFRVYLPVTEEEQTGGSSNNRTGSPSRTASPGTETILVVEDDEAVLDLACRILRDNGYTALAAGDGEGALRLCEKYDGPIHVLLADVILPGGMSGRDLADELALLRPDLRVVYMSGHTSESIARHGVLEEGVAFVEKPFTPSSLLGQVRAVLDG